MGKRVKDEDLGFVPDELEEETQGQVVTQTAGLSNGQPKQQPPDDELGFVPDEPVKKKDGSPASSTTSSDGSPAAEYRQSLQDFSKGYQELQDIRLGAGALRDLLKSGKDVEGKPLSPENFKAIRDQYNDLARKEQDRIQTLQSQQIFLRENKASYIKENAAKQDRLFKVLGVDDKERNELVREIFKQQNPDKADQVDAGTFIPTELDVDAEDLSKMLTGKSMKEVERFAQVRANRTISERAFGSFAASVNKVLAFDLPASTMATLSNTIKGVQDHINDDLLTKAIKLVAPDAVAKVDKEVTDLRVAAFEWGREHREKDFTMVPGPLGIPTMVQNDKNLIQSISQIKSPLDIIDFVFASAGQGAAQIIPAVASRGMTAYSQEIGHTYLEGVIRIAEKLSAAEGKEVTPEDVIRRGLDEAEIARNFGVVQGAMESLGATKALRAFGLNGFKKDLREKSLTWLKQMRDAGKTEFITETLQSASQQVAVGKMKGLQNIEALKDVNVLQALDEGIAGAIGGVAVSSPGAIMSKLQTVRNLKEAPPGTPEAATYGKILEQIVKKYQERGDKRPAEEIEAEVETEVIDKVEPTAEPAEVETETEVTPETEAAPEAPAAPAKPKPKKFSFGSKTEGQFSEKERIIAEHLGKFTSKSWARHGDKNFMSWTRSARFYINNKTGTPIDVQAQYMSQILNPEGDGNEITPQDIVDFVEKFPNPKQRITILKKEDTDEIAEEIAPEVETDAGIMWHLEQIYSRGITLENLESPEVQAVLGMFSEEDVNTINLILEYGQTEEGRQKIDQLRAAVNSETGEAFREGPGLSEVQGVQGQAEQEIELNEFGYPKSWDIGSITPIPQELGIDDLIGNLDQVLGINAETAPVQQQGAEGFIPDAAAPTTVPPAGVPGTQTRPQKQAAVSTNKDQGRALTLTDKALPVYDAEGNQTGTKPAREFVFNQPGVGDAKGTIVGDKASILEIFAEKDEEGNAKRGGNLYQKVIDALTAEGVNQIVIGMQSEGSTRALQKLVQKGVLKPNLENNEKDLHDNPIRFDIVKAEDAGQYTFTKPKPKEEKPAETTPAPAKPATVEKTPAPEGDKGGYTFGKPDPGQEEKPAPEPEKPKTADVAVKRSTKIAAEIDDLFKDLDKTLGGTLSAGINPEAAIIGGKIVAKYIELGVVKFAEIAADVYKRYGEKGLRNYFQALKAGYGSMLATEEDTTDFTPLDQLRAMDLEQTVSLFKQFNFPTNDTSTAGNLEPDSQGNTPDQQVGAKAVSDERSPDRDSTGKGKQETQQGGVGQQIDFGFSDRISPPSGPRPDTGMVDADKPKSVTERPGRGADPDGGDNVDVPGVSVKPATAENPQGNTGAEGSVRFSPREKLYAQQRAEGVAVTIKDKDNIAKTLPYLLPHQHENVLKAENRFFTPPREGDINKGIGFTDGTGTGKTYVGLGIAKRFAKMGKPNILIVVPTDTKAKDWMEDGKNLFLDIKQLKDTKDNGGQGSMVTTTYANFRANEALLKREFDLVIYDEAHKLVSNQQGDETAADIQHKKLTGAPDEAAAKAREKFQSLIDKDYDNLGRLSENTQKLIDAETNRLVEKTKVVFLSATPFSYHKNLEYADGYLFIMSQGQDDKAKAYNNFFIKNFGYRYRYSKLTLPETGVDVSLMERMFHTNLVKAGAISSTRLTLDRDYSREFVLVDDKLGMMIDEGFRATQLADDQKQIDSKGNEVKKYLPGIARRKFSWLYNNQLLEAIKAKHTVERINKHLQLGRKVIVFHGYINNLPSHPFDFMDPILWPQEVSPNRIMAEINEFYEKFPQYRNLDLTDLKNPIDTLKDYFGDELLVFNGTVPKGKRKSIMGQFNDDQSGKNVMIIQMEAGKEGISLHDVTGVHQRAMINLGLPYKPTDAIQTEGRPYRYGVQSDAVFEYMVLHTGFEKFAFGQKINERTKTAENLAFGEQARNLEETFKEGYKNPTQDDPGDHQGKGGKETDGNFDVIDDFQKAITFYIARGKRNAKTRAREGTDYFATPEPIGLKMVEWLQLKPSDKFLEPSGGHGAIARWAPGNTTNHFIEPSYELRADLAINTIGEVIPGNFEDHHIVNKYNGVAMNPPFGASGKTAMDHFVKGLGHLYDGGRLIAILPDGPAMAKRLDAWIESEESEGFHVRARIKLPAVTFERAGTKVKTQIIVVDKMTDPGIAERFGPAKDISLDHTEGDINALFEAIKDMQMPPRLQPDRATVEAVIRTIAGDNGKVHGAAEPLAQIVLGKHTKTGKDIVTVKLNRLLDAADWQKIHAQAKKHKGYYSSFTGGGAVRGWIMPNEAAATEVVNFIDLNFQEDTGSVSDENASRMVANPSKGRTHLSSFETRILNGNGKPFKIYQSVIDLAKKYNPGATLGQGYNTKGAWGTFYRTTKNVRINGLTDLSVAMHELTHALDKRSNVVEDFINQTGFTDPLRKRLTELYVKYYPGAKESHNVRIRMIEGYATLVQKYLEFPNDIKTDFPDLIDAFLTPGGKYWVDDVGLFLEDVEKIIMQYQALQPLDKFGARIVDGHVKEVSDDRYPTSDKVTKEVFDLLYPIEKLFRKAGLGWSQDDVSLWIRLANNAYQIAHKNISSVKQEFWGMDSKGKFAPKHKFNYLTIVRRLEKRKLQTDFASYLYARRIKSEFEEMHGYEDELAEVMTDAWVQDQMQALGINQDAAEALQRAKAADLQKEIDRLARILSNEGISEIEARDAHDIGSKLFQEEETMFDALTDEDLEFAHNPMVGLLDDEGYKKFKSREGYAPFKRTFYDELVGDIDIPTIKGTGKTKVSQFLTRRGSAKPVLNPLIGAMMNHAEVMRKGMRQMVNNKFVDVVKRHPEAFGDTFQILPLKTSPDPRNRFPQEKDPDIIMARINGKRVPMLASREITSILEENFHYHNLHLLEHVGIRMAQLFRTGTTGIFWQFFINNTFLDQIAASINTRNGMFPFISSMRQITPALLNRMSETALWKKVFGPITLLPNSMEAAYLKEYLYLAGTSQTFLSADIANRQRLEDMIIGNDKTVPKRIGRFFENIIKIMTIPGNATEMMTRGTEYILARKAGKDQLQALEEAGRVSAPFHHMGRLGGNIGRSAVRTIPYFNASLQVFKQTKDILHTKEGRIRYAFAAMAMIATSVSSMLHLLDRDEEDEQRQQLKTLPPEVMSKYLFLPNPFSSKKLLQIRVPEQVGWLAAMTNMMLISAADETDYKWSEWAEAGVSFAPTQVNPFNPTQMLFSYVPPAVKAPIETAMGIKTYPNIRPIESQKDKSLPEEMRFNKYTSPGAITLGEVFGFSPKKIDHLLEGTFGRSIKYLTGKPGTYGVDRIFQREMYFEASRQIQYFYDVKTRVEQDVKVDVEELQEFTEAERDKMYAVYGVVSEIEGMLEALKMLDEEVDAVEASTLRNEIFKKVRELERLSY